MTLPSSTLPPALSPGPRWVVHPPLLAAAFVLEVALSNKIEPAGFGRSLVVAVVAAVTLTLLLWAVTRDRWLGGLLASSLILASISLLPFYFMWEALRTTFDPAIAAGAFAFALLLAIALPTVQLVRARRGKRLIRRPATDVLNRFATVLVLVVVILHVAPDLPGAAADAIRQDEPVSVVPAVSRLPDIFVILLDGYPRADVLARRFGIDNSAFLDDLRGLGFDVAEHSHSNYVFTQLTLASMFQMRHLSDMQMLQSLIGTPGVHVNALRNAINHGPAFAALHAAGYQIVATLPGYEHVALRGAADRILDHGEMNDLEHAVLERTWLLDPLDQIVPGIFSAGPRDRIVRAFDDLDAMATEARDRPIFAWVHLPAPHLPLVMDAQGRTLLLDPRRIYGHDAEGFGMTDAQFSALYAGELAYLNQRTVEAVRSLQGADGRADPVIVILSDHGYTTDLADTRARFGNLFAASTPQAPGLLADAPTPVNLMPTLLNRYLGTDFAFSPDRYFLSLSEHQLLELTEVADPDASAGTP